MKPVAVPPCFANARRRCLAQLAEALAHGGSLIFVVEMQVRYIMDVLRKMAASGIGSVECRPDVYDRYNRDVDRVHAKMVWTHPGMHTYYRNSRGRVVVPIPFRNVDFFEMLRSADLSDFSVETRAS